MLLKEYRDLMEELSGFKITNTYLARVLGTSSQNISKRIKNDSVLTTSELSILEKTTGIYCVDETQNLEIKNRVKSLERNSDEIIVDY